MQGVTDNLIDHYRSETLRKSERDPAPQQRVLQDEAAVGIAELDLSRRPATIGPVYVTGSFLGTDGVAGAGHHVPRWPRLSPTDCLADRRAWSTCPGIVGFEYLDERGNRSPTG